MPWSNGVYTRSNGVFTGAAVWASDASVGTNITTGHHDTHDQDLATGLNNCLTVDGLNQISASFIPKADAAYDLGSGTFRWGSLYISGNITGGTLVAPTITSPALSGTSTGTYTLGGTVTVASPVITGTITGTYTIGGTPTIGAATLSGTLTATGQTITGGTHSGATLSGTTTLPDGGSIASGGAQLGAPTGGAKGSGTLNAASGIYDNGSRLKNYYDFSFNAGLQSDGTFSNLAVQTYGELVVSRAVTVSAEQLYMDTAPTGTAAIFDILKNGSTIYSAKPQVAIGANAGTAGTLSVTSFAAGDRMTFKCTQKGSTIAGAGARFTLNATVN